MDKSSYAYPRIAADIMDQTWFADLPDECQVAFFRLWLSCDVIGVAEYVSIPFNLLGAMDQKGLVLYGGGYILFCEYIDSQRTRASDIPGMIEAFVECPVPDFKAYLMERYYHLFTEERLDKFNRGVLVRDLGVPFSEWRKLRAQVFARDAYTCRYCGRHVDTPHCDHVVPLCKGGKTELDNLVTACPACNFSKHDKTPEEWRHGR